MAVPDVLIGLQTWSDCISTSEQSSAIGRQTKQLIRSQADIANAVRSGLGAIEMQIAQSAADLAREVGIGLDSLADGVAELRADFNVALTEVIWLQQLQSSRLKNILEVLQSPLDTSARELRRRAETAYANGWYPEALSDFLRSAEVNYQDFAVHRSVANIYLLHCIELEKATDYFQRAAKYAAPVSPLHAAESHYFAGMSLAVQRRFAEAAAELSAATALNEQFYEAMYLHACVDALRGDMASLRTQLRAAIAGDLRYHARAEQDVALAKVSEQVHEILSETLAEARAATERRLAEIMVALQACSKTTHSAHYERVIGRIRQRVGEMRVQLDTAGYSQLIAMSRTADKLYLTVHAVHEVDRSYSHLADAEAKVSRVEESIAALKLQHENLARAARRQERSFRFVPKASILGMIAGWFADRALNTQAFFMLGGVAGFAVGVFREILLDQKQQSVAHSTDAEIEAALSLVSKREIALARARQRADVARRTAEEQRHRLERQVEESSANG